MPVRTQLSKELVIFITIISTILQTLNLIAVYQEIEWLKVTGFIVSICLIIATLFTTLHGLCSTEVDDLDYAHFTDRHELVHELLQQISNMLYNKNTVYTIKILCGSDICLGQTTLLKYIKFIFLMPRHAKSVLSNQEYKLYKKIKRRLGNVSYLDGSELQNYTPIHILGRKDLILIDRMESYYAPYLPTHKCIKIYCEYTDIEQEDSLRLTPFKRSDIAAYYQSIYARDIEDNVLEFIDETSGGNISRIVHLVQNSNSIDYSTTHRSLLDIVLNMNTFNYDTALQKIRELKSSKAYLFEYTDMLKWRVDFLYYDAIHLKNKYTEALEGLESLYTVSDSTDKLVCAEKISHVHKHLGHTKNALEYLQDSSDYTRKTQSLSLYIMDYNMTCNTEAFNCLQNLIHTMSKEPFKYIKEDKDSYNTYKAVLLIYKEQYKEALQCINSVITLYRNLKSKHLTNCYFIKGELYRHKQDYNRAVQYYLKCIDIYNMTGDFDVYSMAYALLLYTTTKHQIPYNFIAPTSLEDTFNKCVELGIQYNTCVVQKVLHATDSNFSFELKTEATRYLDKHVFVIP